MCINTQSHNKFPERTNLEISTKSMKNTLKCEARAREGTKQFFISLRKVKIELLESHFTTITPERIYHKETKPLSFSLFSTY